jgi:putative phosphoesterase
VNVLVVSDIHGNRAALDAVATVPHDAVLCLGDIVGYGPDPHACVRWVREHATWTVQGNHDRANADNVPPRCQPDFAWLAESVVPLTRAQLDADDVRFLRHLPRWAVWDLAGLRIACVHARPSDPLYGYMPRERAAWARELEHVRADLLLVGHTHVPFDFQIGQCRVVNPGSVGQPKDGDWRAAFALVVDGEPQLRRMAYPVEDTVAALRASDVDRRAVDALGDMLRTGKPWRSDTQPALVPVG